MYREITKIKKLLKGVVERTYKFRTATEADMKAVEEIIYCITDVRVTAVKNRKKK